MPDQLPLFVSGGISLLSLLSVAYFAGRFSERLDQIENAITEKSGSLIVETKFNYLSAQNAKIEQTLVEVKGNLHDVQRALDQLTAIADDRNRRLPSSHS